MKKIAVMIYPYFCMQEISCLTDGLKVFFDIDVEVFASTKEVIKSEENFKEFIDEYRKYESKNY